MTPLDHSWPSSFSTRFTVIGVFTNKSRSFISVAPSFPFFLPSLHFTSVVFCIYCCLPRYFRLLEGLSSKFYLSFLSTHRRGKRRQSRHLLYFGSPKNIYFSTFSTSWLKMNCLVLSPLRRVRAISMIMMIFSAIVQIKNVYAGFRPGDYSTYFTGEGTYYGETDGGNCAMGKKALLPKMYQRMLPVAINEDQYDNSRSCGACIELEGKGKGIGGKPIRGRFLAYVHDRCPECKRGDLDLSTYGDGRWHIRWRFVPCPGSDASFVFEGCNTFYKKIQLRGMKYPPLAMTIDGRRGVRSQDNFFIATDGRPFRSSGKVRVLDIKLNAYQGNIKLTMAAGVMKAPAAFNGGGRGGGRRPGKPKPKRKPKPYHRPKPKRKSKCIPIKHRCRGSHIRRNRRCCGNSRCRRVYWSPYLRCVPKHRRRRACVPKGQYCNGRRRFRGRRGICCGKSVCRRKRGEHHPRCL